MSLNLRSTQAGPIEISRFWKYLPEEFQSSIDAAVNWTFSYHFADLMRAVRLTVSEEGDWRNRQWPHGFKRLGYMMHHTKCNSLACHANVINDDAKLPLRVLVISSHTSQLFSWNLQFGNQHSSIVT
jgi:hypothetical protein